MANHWYDKEGNPCYTVVGANGKVRDTTLRDARKLDLVPSVTTITSVLSKPGLDYWKLQQMIEASFECRDQQNKEFFIKQVWDLFKDNTSIYSKVGDEYHNKLEEFYTHGTANEEDQVWMQPVVECIEELGFPLIQSELSFTAPEGYGGKIDLILRDGDRTAILDFKTKHKDTIDKKVVTSDHAMQLAAYRQAIDPKAECYNLFISVTNPGHIYNHKHDEDKLVEGYQLFTALHKVWKLMNNMDAK